MKTERSCPVCGAHSRELLYERVFCKLSDALLDGYRVVSCSECGFCFADNLPDQAAFDAYYERQSKYEHHVQQGGPSEYDLRRLPFAAGIISGWLPHPKTATILDVGCATGGLLAELRKQGYSHLCGVDPSPACADIARRLYDVEVHPASISGIPQELGPFDLIIFGSVLEHILDFEGTIRRIKRLLRPGGCVYVEVPDMTRCAKVDDAPFQEFSVEHINYFGPISLVNLWEQYGFQKVGLRQTEIEQRHGLSVYEIKAMFRLPNGSSSPSREFDHQTRPEILRYIACSARKLDNIEGKLNALAQAQRPIVVWGVGTHTQSLLATTQLKNARITAFIDSNVRYAGQTLNGVPIVPPEHLHKVPYPVLVSSQQFQGEIVNQIRNGLQANNEIITLY